MKREPLSMNKKPAQAPDACAVKGTACGIPVKDENEKVEKTDPFDCAVHDKKNPDVKIEDDHSAESARMCTTGEL